jgi:isopenicillin N synthase-like dioxygenase
MGSCSVPVIDLSRPNGEIVNTVLNACTTAGFFVVSNHGVPHATTQQMFQQNAEFFALPNEEKLKIKVNDINR